MNLLQSLDFLENNWDKLSKSPDISQDSIDSLIICEKKFSDESEKNEKELIQLLNNDKEIIGASEGIISLSDTVEKCITNIQNDTDILSNLKKNAEESNNSNVNRDIYHYLNVIRPKMYGNFTQDEIIEISAFIQKYPCIRKIHPLIYNHFQGRKNAMIKSCRNYLIKTISSFSEQNIQYEDVQNCKNNFKFYKFYFPDSTELIEECIKQLAANIIRNKLQRNPFKQVDDSYIETIIQCKDLNSDNLPPAINYESTQEFKIIRFILELDKIIDDVIQPIPMIFTEEDFSFISYFSQELQKKYVECLQNIKFTLLGKNYIEDAMRWFLVFRIFILYRITNKVNSPYQVCISNMIDATIDISDKKSAKIYNEYIGNNKKLFNEKKREFDNANKYTDDRKLQIKFCKDLFSFYKKDFIPSTSKLSLYYAELVKHRSNFDAIWYRPALADFVESKNPWITKYFNVIQELIPGWKFLARFDEDLQLSFLGNLNICIGEFEDLKIRVIEPYLTYYLQSTLPKSDCFVPFTLSLREISPDFSIYNSDEVDQKYQNYIIEIQKFIQMKVDLILNAFNDANSNFWEYLMNLTNEDRKNIDLHNMIKKFVKIIVERFANYYAIMAGNIKKGDAPFKSREEVIDDINRKLLPENF